MSASREKKSRQELNASGYVDPKVAEQKANESRQNRTTSLYLALLGLVVIGAIVLGVVNSGVLRRDEAAATIDGESYTAADVGYYFYNTYNTFVSQNSGYLSLYGLDTSKPLREQPSPMGDDTSWFDYFADIALNDMASAKKLAAAAKAEGFDAGDAMDAAEKESMESVKTYASQAGYSAKQYLKAVFGSAMTEKAFIENVRESALVDAYRLAYVDSLSYTDAELQAAYDANPKNYQSADIEYIVFNQAPEAEATDTEKAALLAEQETAAKVAVERYAAGESFEAIAEDLGGSYFHNASAANGVSEMLTWAFDDARNSGDTTTVAYGTTGYYAVVFHSRMINDYHPVTVRHVLVEDQETADSILAEYKAGEMTEDAFSALAAQYSTDGGSKANGGLYSDVAKGQMVDEFEAWCFDAARKTGDTGIVKTNYGYHVMYFVSASAQEYWQVQTENDLTGDAYDVWLKEIVGEPVIEKASGMDQIG